MGSDIALLFRPRETYATLARAEGFSSWQVLRRPALTALVLGASLLLGATAATELPSLISVVLWWSFVPLIQFAAAYVFVASFRARPIPLNRAVDLMLAGHAPWSLWILLVGLCFMMGWYNGTGQMVFGIAAITVMCWRAVILYHFSRAVLQVTRNAALVRTLLHQLTMAGIIVLYVCWAIAWEARF